MTTGIWILSAERDGDDGLIVTFSDGTTGGYVAEELLELRPFRERVKTKKSKAAPVDTCVADGLRVAGESPERPPISHT